MLSRILTLSIFLSLPALAADDCTPTVVDQSLLSSLAGVSQKLNQECPRTLVPATLCSFVKNQTEETIPGKESNGFAYRTYIYESACVEPGDSPQVIQAKIQNFWNRYHHTLVCDELGSAIRGASLLKFATEKLSLNFINDAVRRWKVNLNHVDPHDQMTVLDYIDQQRTQRAGTAIGNAFERYFKIFRDNGAKFKREL